MTRIRFLLLVCLIVALVGCLAACFGPAGEPPHVHSWSEEWIPSGDGVHQYKVCDGCDEILEEEIPPAPPTDETLEYILTEEETITIVGIGTYLGTTLEIPEKIDGYRVTRIEDYALSYSELTEVVIPDTVTYIGEGALSGCPLERLTVPFVGRTTDEYEEQRHFGFLFGAQGAPSNCDYVPNTLETVVVTGGTSLDGRAFYGCESIQSISLPDTLVQIGSGAFEECTSLAEVHLTDLAAWCQVAFEDAFSTPFTFGASLYLDGTQVKNLIIPDEIEVVNAYAFRGITSLLSIRVPNSVEYIGESAFSCCDGITSVTLPFVGQAGGDTASGHFGSIFGVGSSAQRFLPKSLETITITGGTQIGMYAFEGCESVKKITLPATLQQIGDHAFRYCTSLEGVYIEDIKAWCETTFVTETSNPLYYAKHLYLNGEEAKIIDIPDGTKRISDYAFYGCEAINAVAIPKTTLTIGKSAFQECTALIALTMEKGLTQIDTWAFQGCVKLEEVVVPQTVTNIGSGAFRNCTSLASMTIPFVGMEQGATGNNHFGIIFGAGFASYNNDLVPKALKTVTVTGGGLIGEKAFSYCQAVEEVHVQGVTELGNRAFEKCIALKTVVLLDTETIGENAFSECTALSSINLGDDLETIEGMAFYSCSNLGSITIPATTKLIGREAFLYCNSLSSVFISTSGWYYAYDSTYTEGTNVDMSDPAVAAKYLREDYRTQCFMRH